MMRIAERAVVRKEVYPNNKQARTQDSQMRIPL